MPPPLSRPAGGLRNGDHLTQPEFHRRYLGTPESFRAELVEGVVYLSSPVSLDRHGVPHLHLAGWLAYYMSKTPGLIGGDNSTVLLDNDNEPQPDLLLGIPNAAGGLTRTVREGDKHYVHGPVELLIEVAASSASIDLHGKLRAYQRNGVREYLVTLTEAEADEPKLRWHVSTGGQYQLLPEEDGMLKSRVFPGLWLDTAAWSAGDLAKLLAAIDRGCETPEHAELVQRLDGATAT